MDDDVKKAVDKITHTLKSIEAKYLFSSLATLQLLLEVIWGQARAQG